MREKILRILPAFGLLLVLAHCNKEDEPAISNYTIEFLLEEEGTGNPIEGAQIQLEENGNAVTTQADGVGVFKENDLKAVEKLSNGDEIFYAFSISHAAFQPQEVVVGLGKTTVKLVPEEIETDPEYTYTVPELLEDGLAVGTLADAGMDKDKIEALILKNLAEEYKELHSILIYKDGKLVLEEYFFGNNDTIDFEGGVTRDSRQEPIMWTREDKHYIASVNKALTSSLTGIALEENGLSTDALLKDYLPEYASVLEMMSKRLRLPSTMP